MFVSHDIEGDIEDVIRLVVWQVAFEEVEAAIDLTDQPDLAGEQEHGADSTARQTLHPVGQLVLDDAGGDHGALPLRTWAILDSLDDSPLALSQLVEDSRVHSKTSIYWSSEDVLLPELFQENRGLSSFLSRFCPHGLYFTLGSAFVGCPQSSRRVVGEIGWPMA
jgi:hypothetical protein